MLRSVDMRAALCALLTALLAARAAAQERTAPRCRDARCQERGTDLIGQRKYEVDGHNITIVITQNDLEMNCNWTNVLESPALPYFASAPRVSFLKFSKCPLPAAGSLADTLAALNVTLKDDGSLAESLAALNETLESINVLDKTSTLSLWDLPAVVPLTAKHFVGLEHLVHLNIGGNEKTRPIAKPGFLAPLQSLRSLTISTVGLLTGELDVPPSLRKLSLYLVNVTRLPVVPTLEKLTMNSWTERRPAPLTRCDSLRVLEVWPTVDALPAGWLENCPRLEVLSIELTSNLTTLPPKLLAGTTKLNMLTIKQAALPAGLLDYSPNLESLILSSNNLQTLPSGMFDVARRVQRLILYDNDLETSAVKALSQLTELTTLDLEYNSRIGDLCGADGYSPIRHSTQMLKLYLRKTGVTRICRDWREDMLLLFALDLSETKVTELSLQIKRTVDQVLPEVILQEMKAPVTVVGVTREDYENAARGAASEVYLKVDNLAPVECDCRMYWTRRALDLSLPIFELVKEMSCTDGRPLSEVSPEDMVCARPEECAAAELPAACACDERPDADSSHDRLLVRVRCEHAGLTSVPRPRARDDSTERLYELYLAYNRISNLQADDLKNNIKALDLRNNSLTGVDEETASRLGDIAGMLRVTGNPLECSCRAAPLLRALHARNATQIDWINGTCGAAGFLAACSPGAGSPAPRGCPAASLMTLLALAALW